MQLAKVFSLDEKKNKKVRVVDYDKTSKPWPEWILLNNGRIGMAEVIIKEKKGARRVRYARYVPEKLLVRVEVLPKTMEKFYDRFAKSYDTHVAQTNKPAAKFLADKISKLIPKDAKILDIGAGTGLLAEELARKGFTNITLTDFSKEMLAKAKKKKILKNCKFIRADFKKQILRGKYDIVASVFSFSCAPYFLEEEMPQSIKKVKSLLKPKGYFAVFGHDYEYLIEKSFRKLAAGTKTLLGREHSWFIGRK